MKKMLHNAVLQVDVAALYQCESCNKRVSSSRSLKRHRSTCKLYQLDFGHLLQQQGIAQTAHNTGSDSAWLDAYWFLCLFSEQTVVGCLFQREWFCGFRLRAYCSSNWEEDWTCALFALLGDGFEEGSPLNIPQMVLHINIITAEKELNCFKLKTSEGEKHCKRQLSVLCCDPFLWKQASARHFM